MSETNLGEFEEMVLLAVCSLSEDAYSVPVQHHLEEVIGRTTTLGAVHRALARLERKGYVRSWMGKSAPVRGGKPKRMYQVTGLGKNALYSARMAREKMWSFIQLTPSGRIA